MKILNLKVKNVKKISAVDITPVENTIVISGRNEQGKTSVLDSILYALVGKKAMPSQPIKQGEKKAEITIDLGDYVVKKIITPKSDRLEITGANGNITGQQLLDNITGSLSFDPLEFSNMKSKDQVKLLKDISGIDFDALDSAHTRIYNERTIIGREVKRQEALLKPIDEALPKNELDAGDILIELEKSKQVDTAKREITNIEQEIYNIQDQIRMLNVKLKERQELKTVCQEKYDNLVKECKNTNDLSDMLNNIQNKNKAIRENNEAKKHFIELSQIKDKYLNYTLQLEDIEKDKLKIIATAKMPITGLSFNEKEVLYNNLPFEQLNEAMKLRISISIAIALNPTLRVIRITNGSLLDSKNLEIIKDIAKENDYQIWIEKVDETGKCGIVIEEGSVIANNYENKEVVENEQQTLL